MVVLLLMTLASLHREKGTFEEPISEQREKRTNTSLSPLNHRPSSTEQEVLELLRETEKIPTSSPTHQQLHNDTGKTEIIKETKETETKMTHPQSSSTSSSTTTTTTTTDDETPPQSNNNITDPKMMQKIQAAQDVANRFQREYPWFADMDLSTGYAEACGMNKCFFASRANPQTYGYLVARSSQYKQMVKAHNLEAEISQKFGTPLLSESLQVIQDVPKPILQVIMDYSLQWGYKEPRPILSKHHTSIVVQNTRRVPSPYLTAAFTKRKGGSMLKRLPEFIPQISDPRAFNQTFLEERQRMLETIRAFPSLLDDFQFIVDTHGKIYHIDLDRNGYDEKYTDEEIEEDVYLRARDLMWLLEHLTPSLNHERSHFQECLHSFCRDVKDPWVNATNSKLG